MTPDMVGWDHTVRVLLVFPIIPVCLLFLSLASGMYAEMAEMAKDKGSRAVLTVMSGMCAGGIVAFLFAELKLIHDFCWR